MAVAFDAATEKSRGDTSNPHAFNHTGRAEVSGGVQGVVVTAVHGQSSTDHITGITYGGVALTRIATAADTAGEPGRADLWFVGSGLAGKGGTQSVSINFSSATDDNVHFVAITLTGGLDIEAVDSDTVEQDTSNPSVTLQYGGRTCLAIGALYGGGAGPSEFTPNANCQTVHDQALGFPFYSEVIRQSAPGSADFTIGGTAALDDVAFVAAAFAEAVTAYADDAALAGAVSASAQGIARRAGAGAIAAAGDTMAAGGVVLPDPPNLAITLDDGTAHLTWDESPLLT